MAPPPQKPETFMLSSEAQQSLPQDAQVALQQVDNLKYFLISAPVDWSPDQLIRRFLLPTGDYISCVLWNNLFHISGTDIVRCLSFRFQAFGRPVKNSKKFEEGIFSDLRNLKSGTDASLEEPKSPFLDFLYKNNCIRTQKKQKVFYWYSVPHDRLFLDALERDLKREKMGQEATTVAVAEPALSFEFDSSQSLYEQLTKAQQANSSSFAAHASTTYGQPTSPVVRSVDAMPPPQMAPSAMTMLPEDNGNSVLYNQVTMPMKRENDYVQIPYDRSASIPINRLHQRHTSMPSYMEYSPAPSFVSSQYEDYSNRGISFEPITPPQQALPLGAEPAYIANEETGLYTAIPDVGSTAFNPMMQLPPSNFSTPLGATSRPYQGNVFSVIEGSPTYKQRRRRSSIPPGITNAIAAAQGSGVQTQATSYAAYKPSDLRRSVSNSVGPVTEAAESNDQHAPGTLQNGFSSTVASQKDMLHEVSRTGTPLPSLEEGVEQTLPMMQQQDELAALANQNVVEASVPHSLLARGDRPGPVRRARSATMMELGPYPQKSHSCPIPSCGRLFKRLEHLKRHRRTHETQQDGQSSQHPLSDEYLENEEKEFGSLEEDSPGSDGPSFVHPSVVSMSTMTPMSAASSMPMQASMSSMVAPHLISPQYLQQQM
ncbi:Transcription factor steA [Talaromyces atroroseus]|uniref:Transcription factor steA n=1 Tax=Talaromyces atroroseus TaxID=1441469 RepID=A0A225B2C9_TALAT|nr:Transcription factor steA [Talaromyces atroroseus]OKL62129.1 Transcription factor steA [Talaromyces atroroseus]